MACILGCFFRPIGEPNFFQPIILGILGGAATAVFRMWRVRPFKFGDLAKQMALSVVGFTFFLVMLEFRHHANALGGKTAVILLSTAIGVLMGLSFAYTQSGFGKPKI